MISFDAKKIKYILYDLDGTLTDSAMGIVNSFKYAFGVLGVDYGDDSELLKFVGPPLSVSFGSFGYDKAGCDEAIKIYRTYYADKGIFENSVYDGIPEALEKLGAAGYIQAVATSKPEVYAKMILKRYGLDKHFVTVCGIPLGDETMTKSEVIERTLGILEVTDKSQAVMVGDRDYDVRGAHQNGIACIGVGFGYGSHEELDGAGACRIADTPKDLANLFLNSETV